MLVCVLGGCDAPREKQPPLRVYVSHMEQLQARLPRGLSMVMHPPFIVIGQGDQGRVQRVSDRLLGLAVPRLKRDFFERDPETTDVWLLDNAESYRAITRRLFKEEPSTPYGFYVRERRTMVMNLGTGGGTLLHEIVHPYMAANFPKAPAWFNEGMGSLFEQAAIRDDRLVGIINMRLPGLKQQLREATFGGLDQLLHMSDEDFYVGDNYGAARYLLYYLQEHGLLQQYYTEYRRDVDSDPSGASTLLRVVDARDLASFEAHWSSWVLAL